MRNLFLSLVFLILSPLFCFSQILTNVTLNGNLTVGNGLSGVGSSTFDMTNSTNYYEAKSISPALHEPPVVDTNIQIFNIFLVVSVLGANV